MDLWYSAEMEGELLLIGIIAIVAAFIYHKLDKMMQLQERSNELLERIADGKSGGEEKAKGEDK